MEKTQSIPTGGKTLLEIQKEEFSRCIEASKRYYLKTKRLPHTLFLLRRKKNSCDTASMKFSYHLFFIALVQQMVADQWVSVCTLTTSLAENPFFKKMHDDIGLPQNTVITVISESIEKVFMWSAGEEDGKFVNEEIFERDNPKPIFFARQKILLN